MSDWFCPGCNYKIFGKKLRCNKCNIARGGSILAPLARPSDWMCPNCNYLIFGSKTECNTCKAPRPVPRPVPVFEAPRPAPPIPIPAPVVEAPINGGRECQICFVASFENYSFNCGHVVCGACNERIGRNKCPFCRVTITNRVRLFL